MGNHIKEEGRALVNDPEKVSTATAFADGDVWYHIACCGRCKRTSTAQSLATPFAEVEQGLVILGCVLWQS
jgi:uncharacterized protein YcgI (DUF1989 family)